MKKSIAQKQFEAKFSDLFRQVRAERDLTQVEFGSLLGIEAAEISVYENAKRLPSLYRLAKMANVLNMDISDLIPKA